MKLERRTFIKLIPVVAVAVASGSWWFLRQTAREPTITPQPTVTTSAASQATSTSPTAFDFPVTWNGDRVPKVDSNEYRLRIDGDVPNPLELTLEELYGMSNVQKKLKIQCVEGWAADVPWDGISLSYLLSRAGASLENIAHVTVASITGYSTTLDSNEVANSDIIIALKAGGAPLTAEHGYPARLVAPTRSGLDWVKCVGRITCTNK